MFRALDPDNPATTSARIIEKIIRGQLGFDGLLMTDDTSMKALSGDFAQKTDAIFGAGCDVILHCNGDFEEMSQISAHTPVLQGAALERANRVMSLFGSADNEDEKPLREEFEGLIAGKMSVA